MSKRPTVDYAGLATLTSEVATPMQEAMQRNPAPVSSSPIKSKKVKIEPEHIRTEDLKPLAFKVPPAFRRRYKQRAVTADLKLNELLFEALDAWEEKKGLKKINP